MLNRGQIPFGGEMAALTCAALWAAASVIYGRIGRNMSPAGMNLLKNSLAIGMFAIALVISGDLFKPVAGDALGLLVISGMIGLGLGDTLFFVALKHLGPRRTLLTGSLVPPLTAIIALIFLNEQLSLAAWGGILLTVTGVAWVIHERTPEDLADGRNVTMGIRAALVAVVTQSISASLAHTALIQSEVTALQATVLRLVAGALVVGIYLRMTPQRNRTLFQPPRIPGFWRLLVFSVFIGTFVALWLHQVSLKYTAAGIALALFATSPLFVLPLAARLGERISPRAIMGVLVSIVGVALICLRH